MHWHHERSVLIPLKLTTASSVADAEIDRIIVIQIKKCIILW